jgi:hypothetical protein
LLYDLLIQDANNPSGIVTGGINTDFVPPLTEVYLLLQNVQGQGWFSCDYEKAIIIGKGSILITQIVNNTAAKGIIYSYPQSAYHKAGKWTIQDFRRHSEAPKSPNQTLTVSSESNGLVNISITTGFCEFTGYGMYLVSSLLS